jgi:predicted DNA-binding protein with PD1-like motif
MDPNRRIAQPGPPAAQRIDMVEGRAIEAEFELEPGLVFLEAIRRRLAAMGRSSAVLQLEGGAFGPFTYLMPALSQTGENAAFYSHPFRPPGHSRIESGAVTMGWRDGEPFLHCHGLWFEADGRRNGGHVVPTETVVAEPIRARAWVLDGMAFEARPDAETNFTLFGPVAQPPVADGAASGRYFAVRLRPNQDLCGALEQFCRSHGIAAAEVRGGVGSIIGAVFDDGRTSEPFATEIYFRNGRIRPDEQGAPVADLDIGLVDYTGGLAEGRLRRGENPVLMTVELAIKATG